MKQNSKKNLEVETIGVPIIDALSTEDKKAFAKALLQPYSKYLPFSSVYKS